MPPIKSVSASAPIRRCEPLWLRVVAQKSNSVKSRPKSAAVARTASAGPSCAGRKSGSRREASSGIEIMLGNLNTKLGQPVTGCGRLPGVFHKKRGTSSPDTAPAGCGCSVTSASQAERTDGSGGRNGLQFVVCGEVPRIRRRMARCHPSDNSEA